jgi:hypothetical protein
MNKNSNSKPWYKRFWVWVGIIVLVSIIANALAPKDTPKVADGSSSSSSTTTEQKSEQIVFKPGDVIEFDGKKVTVSAPERNWSSGNEYITAQSGNEFVKLQVTIENDSSSEAMYNTFDWKLQDSKGVIKDVASVAFTVDGALNSGQLASGGKVAGFLVFEVPTADTGLTLRYSPSFWSDKKIEIKL